MVSKLLTNNKVRNVVGAIFELGIKNSPLNDTDMEKNRINQISVMKDKTAEQAITYDKMNNKMFTLLSLEIALAGLFSYKLSSIKTHGTVVEWILLYAAISLLGLSAIIIFINYQAKKTWATPMGELEVEKMNNAKSRLASLTVLYDDYRTTYVIRDTVLDKKARYLNAALYLFVISAILLIVLKIGG